jgi:hypothetical protein
LPRSDMHYPAISPVQQHQGQYNRQRRHAQNGTILRYINWEPGKA